VPNNQAGGPNVFDQATALFEQRFSDEEVTAARRKIAAGASLRSAAAEIGCAPSTLSVRIKKAEAAVRRSGGQGGEAGPPRPEAEKA
jgi:hypothetical protein